MTITIVKVLILMSVFGGLLAFGLLEAIKFRKLSDQRRESRDHSNSDANPKNTRTDGVS